MDAAILLAVSIIQELCLKQDSCETCPFRTKCGKQPSEW